MKLTKEQKRVNREYAKSCRKTFREECSEPYHHAVKRWRRIERLHYPKSTRRLMKGIQIWDVRQNRLDWEWDAEISATVGNAFGAYDLPSEQVNVDNYDNYQSF